MSIELLTSFPNYQELPIQAPPPGVIPNFVNPDSNAYQLFTVAGLCLFLICIAASIRLYVKAFILRNWTKDDVPYFLATIVTITYIILEIVLFKNGGYGLHTWDVQIKALSVHQLRLALVLMYTYCIFIWMVKLPLFLLYLEIFGRLRWMKWGCWLGIVVTGLFYLGDLITVIIIYTPRTGTGQLDYLMAQAAATGSRVEGIMYVQGAFNIVSDLFLLILPMPAIWALQLSTRRKLAVSAICFTGILAVSCSCIAFWARIQIVQSVSNPNTDLIWTTTTLWISITAEMACGVIIPAAPSISVFWKNRIVPFTSRLTTSNSRLMPTTRGDKRTSESTASDDDGISLQPTRARGIYHAGMNDSMDSSAIRKTTHVSVFASGHPGAERGEKRGDFV